MIPFGHQPTIGLGQRYVAYRAYGSGGAAPSTGSGELYYAVSLSKPEIRFGFRPVGSGGAAPVISFHDHNPMIVHVGHMMNR